MSHRTEKVYGDGQSFICVRFSFFCTRCAFGVIRIKEELTFKNLNIFIYLCIFIEKVLHVL